MALELVDVRARTRGKSPQEFTYKGVGKVETRKVMDKDNQPIVLDSTGKAVDYGFDKDGKLTEASKVLGFAQDEKSGDITLPEGFRYIEVDDLNTSGVTTELQDVVDLYGANGIENPLQAIIDDSLFGFNIRQRKAASPTTEVDKDDELTPIINDMVAAGILSKDNVGTWRRSVTTSANLMEVDKLSVAEMSKEVKKLRKLATATV